MMQSSLIILILLTTMTTSRTLELVPRDEIDKIAAMASPIIAVTGIPDESYVRAAAVASCTFLAMGNDHPFVALVDAGVSQQGIDALEAAGLTAITLSSSSSSSSTMATMAIAATSLMEFKTILFMDPRILVTRSIQSDIEACSRDDHENDIILCAPYDSSNSYLDLAFFIFNTAGSSSIDIPNNMKLSISQLENIRWNRTSETLFARVAEDQNKTDDAALLFFEQLPSAEQQQSNLDVNDHLWLDWEKTCLTDESNRNSNENDYRNSQSAPPSLTITPSESVVVTPFVVSAIVHNRPPGPSTLSLIINNEVVLNTENPGFSISYTSVLAHTFILIEVVLKDNNGAIVAKKSNGVLVRPKPVGKPLLPAMGLEVDDDNDDDNDNSRLHMAIWEDVLFPLALGHPTGPKMIHDEWMYFAMTRPPSIVRLRLPAPKWQRVKIDLKSSGDGEKIQEKTIGNMPLDLMKEFKNHIVISAAAWEHSSLFETDTNGTKPLAVIVSSSDFKSTGLSVIRSRPADGKLLLPWILFMVQGTICIAEKNSQGHWVLDAQSFTVREFVPWRSVPLTTLSLSQIIPLAYSSSMFLGLDKRQHSAVALEVEFRSHSVRVRSLVKAKSSLSSSSTTTTTSFVSGSIDASDHNNIVALDADVNLWKVPQVGRQGGGALVRLEAKMIANAGLMNATEIFVIPSSNNNNNNSNKQQKSNIEVTKMYITGEGSCIRLVHAVDGIIYPQWVACAPIASPMTSSGSMISHQGRFMMLHVRNAVLDDTAYNPDDLEDLQEEFMGKPTGARYSVAEIGCFMDSPDPLTVQGPKKLRAMEIFQQDRVYWKPAADHEDGSMGYILEKEGGEDDGSQEEYFVLPTQFDRWKLTGLVPNQVRYPPHAAMMFEEHFYLFYRRNVDRFPSDMTYIPITWIAHWHNMIHRPFPREHHIQALIDAKYSDPEKKYFTVLQADTWGELKPGDHWLVFSASGVDKSIPIPLTTEQQSKMIVPSTTKRSFKYLASFIGRGFTHWLRDRLLSHYADDPDFLIVSAQFIPNNHNFATFQQIMSSSVFSLCPRGNGRSSFRVYEALMHGSIPVFITDIEPWLPVIQADVQWQDFAVIVELSELGSLKDILLSYSEKRLRRMRSVGRYMWEHHFNVESACESILRQLTALNEVWVDPLSPPFIENPGKNYPSAASVAMASVKRYYALDHGPSPFVLFGLGRLMMKISRESLDRNDMIGFWGNCTEGSSTLSLAVQMCQQHHPLRALALRSTAQGLICCFGSNSVPAQAAVGLLLLAAQLHDNSTLLRDDLEAIYGPDAAQAQELSSPSDDQTPSPSPPSSENRYLYVPISACERMDSPLCVHRLSSLAASALLASLLNRILLIPSEVAEWFSIEHLVGVVTDKQLQGTLKSRYLFRKSGRWFGANGIHIDTQRMRIQWNRSDIPLVRGSSGSPTDTLTEEESVAFLKASKDEMLVLDSADHLFSLGLDPTLFHRDQFTSFTADASIFNKFVLSIEISQHLTDEATENLASAGIDDVNQICVALAYGANGNPVQDVVSRVAKDGALPCQADSIAVLFTESGANSEIVASFKRLLGVSRVEIFDSMAMDTLTDAAVVIHALSHAEFAIVQSKWKHVGLLTHIARLKNNKTLLISLH